MATPVLFGKTCNQCSSNNGTTTPLTYSPRTVAAGAGRVIPFSSAVPVGIGAFPAGVNIAEIHVDGGSVRFTTDGVAPDHAAHRGFRVSDYGRIELESASEISNFKAIGLPGQSGFLYIEFFTVQIPGNV